MIKDKNYIFQEVSAKSGVNINTLFYKDIHDAIINKFKIGVESTNINVNQDNKTEVSNGSNKVYNY